MNHKQIRKQLEQMNINEAAAEDMNTSGNAAVMLRWNGQEQVFAGIETAGSTTDWEQVNNKKLELMEEWADENLDRN